MLDADAGALSFRNKIINGGLSIDQRNAGASVAVTSSSPYTVDRFVAGMSGANGTAQRITSTAAGFQHMVRLTGTASTTTAWFGTRLESVNCVDLVGQTVTLSFSAASSNQTSLNVNLLYANTVDGFGNGSTVTQIALSSVTISSTMTRYSVTFTNLPAQTANGLYVQVFTAGNLGTGTLDLAGFQLEKGSAATPFEFRPVRTELMLCQRYLPAWSGTSTNDPFGTGQAYSATAANIFLPYQVQPRVAPTGITVTGATSFYLLNAANGVAGTYASTTFYKGSLNGLHVQSATSAGLVAGNATFLSTNTAPAQILATGCEL